MTAMDAVQLRTATLSDSEALARLLGEMGYPADPTALEERLRPLLADGANHLVLVATVNYVVAGVIVGMLMPMLQHERPLGRITALAVDEDQRGLGIGKRLVAGAERWFAERGVSRLELTSAEQRGDAHQVRRPATAAVPAVFPRPGAEPLRRA